MPLSRIVLFACLCFTAPLGAQLVVLPTSDDGGAYAVFRAAGVGIEGPDSSSPACAGGGMGSHDSFGDHVRQDFDSVLQQNVFVFYSHLPEDNDRCVVFDRARMEIKGGPLGATDPALEHGYGDTSFYRWQFRLPEDFVGASSFCHLYQNKAAGGTDSGFPILTLTARESRVELLHNAGDENPSGTLGALATASLDRFRGQWVEVALRQVHTNAGEVSFSITDLATALPIMLYEGAGIDLWRGPDGANDIINRPKWGIYRRYNDALKDETVRYAGFCSVEGDNGANLCESLVAPTDGAPEVVRNVLPLGGSTNVPLYMPLVWDAVPGADGYRVYLGTSPTELTLDTMIAANSYHPALEAATTYYFQIGSVNSEGESRSETQSFTTLTDPDDGEWDVARGHARPEVETDFFELNTNLSMVGLDSVARIGEAGNNAYCFFSGPKEGDNGNYRWRYRQNSEAETTVVVRLSGLEDENNITFVEFYGLGWRHKFRINRSNIKFERVEGDPEIDFPDGFWDDGAFHVLRFTFENNPTAGQPALTTVYVDENPEPFAGPFPSDEEKTSSFVDVGRAGSTNYGACFDYIAVNASGAYAPGAGNGLPSDLAGDLATAPTLTLPLDGSTNVPLTMPIAWQAVENVTNYRVYLGTSPDQLVGDTLVSNTSYAAALMPGTTYYYQVASVNESGESRSDTASFTTLATDDGNWDVVRGHARPEVEASELFEFNTNLEMVVLDSVAMIGSTEDAGNNAYCFLSGEKEDGNSNYRWRYRQEEGQELTVLLRLRPLPDENNITYVEFYGLGWRQKLRINRSTVKFEKTTDDPEYAFPDGFWDDGEFHVLRVTFYNDPEGGPMLTGLYVDEVVTPVATYPSDEEKDGHYLDVGRAGGTDYGACFDYIAINPTGVYPPTMDGTEAPPADLILPDAMVSTTYATATPPLLFPNPVDNELFATGLPENEQLDYRIVDPSGRLIEGGRINGTTHRFTTGHLPSGIYTLLFDGNRGYRSLARFVKH